ncbi:hypothetical protein M8C21_032861, partial [Ambrosia artemisiifolia]
PLNINTPFCCQTLAAYYNRSAERYPATNRSPTTLRSSSYTTSEFKNRIMHFASYDDTGGNLSLSKTSVLFKRFDDENGFRDARFVKVHKVTSCLVCVQAIRGLDYLHKGVGSLEEIYIGFGKVYKRRIICLT